MGSRRLLTALLAFVGSQLVDALEITGRIAPNEVLREVHRLSPETYLSLDGGLAGRTILMVDGSFVFRDVSAGEYVLSVDSREYFFPDLLIKTSDEAANAILVQPFRHTHMTAAHSPALPYPIVITAAAKQEYRPPKAPFSLKAVIMSNPLIILMLAAGLMAFGVPKLLEFIDPEALAEIRAQQRQNTQTMARIQNMDVTSSLSSLLAGSQQPQQPANAKKRK